MLKFIKKPTKNSTKSKLIWFAGIPSSGKTTMAMRLWLELDWAGKKGIMLDDEQLKSVDCSSKVDKVIQLLGAEYNLVISPFARHIPYRPDLIVWCKAPLIECVDRDLTKAHNGETHNQIEQAFINYWGNYQLNADLILNTYDGTRKTREAIEMCWKELKEKMEDVFGDFSWHNYTNSEPAWDSAEPRFQHPEWSKKRLGSRVG
jgi:hypothetical protein